MGSVRLVGSNLLERFVRSGERRETGSQDRRSGAQVFEFDEQGRTRLQLYVGKPPGSAGSFMEQSVPYI